MAEDSSETFRLKSTATNSSFSLEDYPDIAFVDATPELKGDEEPRDRTGERATTTKEEASDRKKHKNLVVCIDGTANQFGLKNTNVVELYSRLVADETQLTYYDSGIGTYVAESNPITRVIQWVENTLDMAFAIHHKRITLSAYQWLSENYVQGDRIYLFGFSRGAYQVRIIAGMIKVVGLLRKGNNNQIQFAYQLYLAFMKVEEREGVAIEPHQEVNVEQRGPETAKQSEKVAGAPHPQQAESGDTAKMCRQFKRTLCHEDVTVHFVGVWDTVSSIGASRGLSFPETTNGMLHVRAFRHALSLHERRGKFLPEYGNGGAGPIPGRGDVKEVWFAGSHSDIGGGNEDNLDLELFGPSLRWMLYEALQHGLRVKPYQGGWSGPEHRPSMTTVWRILEGIPWKRLAYTSKARTERWPPHFSSGRMLQEGQLIHESAIEYLRRNPSPAVASVWVELWVLMGYALLNVCYVTVAAPWVGECSLLGAIFLVIHILYDGIHIYLRAPSVVSSFQNAAKPRLLYNGFWVPVEEHLDVLGIESDSHARTVKDAISALEQAVYHTETPGPLPKSLADTLRALYVSSSGRQSLIDSLDSAKGANLLLDVVERSSPKADQRSDTDAAHSNVIPDIVCRLLAAFPSRPEGCSMRPDLYRWLRFIDPNVRAKVIRTFVSITGHTDHVRSVAYSPDGACIASGSNDHTVRLWSATTGMPVGKPLRGHTDRVLSIAFSLDGTRIVSGSVDESIRLWDAKTHQAIGTPLAGHEAMVNSVAFSPDDRFIASGSDDRTVRIWDAETGDAVGVPLRGHTDEVWAVAFSPDGTHIASGSRDSTIRIWDRDTHNAVRVLEGHRRPVTSIVFSTNGKRIVSGSYDGTVRIWDLETGETVTTNPESSPEYSRTVDAVAVSPDGKYIASGSRTSMVQLWDASTGEKVGEPLQGHTATIWSIAFSPDSRRVISGSVDRRLIIWTL